MPDPFTAALRVELDAVVARYEALAKAHYDLVARAGVDAERQLKGVEERARAVEVRLAACTKDRERLELAVADASRRATEAAERAAALEAELTTALARTDRLNAEGDALKQHLAAFQGVFVAERAFVAACLRAHATPLAGALTQALGTPALPTPPIFATMKQRGLDALLAAALRERGRLLTHATFAPEERIALAELADAASCEPIDPQPGTRFLASAMEKVATLVSPADEGEVIECVLPGLRARGADGALAFPKVVVATG